jgi:hypothetical protein
MIDVLFIIIGLLIVALAGSVIAAKKGWIGDRDKDGIADVIEDRVDIVKDKVEDVVEDVVDAVEDKIDAVKEAAKKITRKKPGRKKTAKK